MLIRIALAAAGVTALVTTAAASPALASTTIASVQTVPAAQSLQAVACSSPTTCVAVGFTRDSQQGVVVPITNGVPGPAQVVPGTGVLQGVACSSASSCVAVGGRVVLPITNGVAGPPLIVPKAILNAVACSSPSFCVAVGSNTVLSIVDGVPGAVQPVPDVSGVTLNGVACPGAVTCYAVGNAPGAFLDVGVVVPITNGVPGTPKTVPGSAGLSSIACTSATTCDTVGPGDFFAGFISSVLVPIVNGTPGTPTSLPFELSLPLGLACADSATCEVVGFNDTGQVVPVVNGTPGPVQAVPGTTLLDAVACPTPTTCFAVGGTGTYPDPYIGVVVTLTVGTIVTHASANVPVGGTITDKATLAGWSNPSGTITFTVFGPNNATCTGTPAFTSPAVRVAGNGDYSSAGFVPAAAGTYRFIAAYSGDAQNNAVTTACNAANESVVVSKVTPTLRTTASPTVAVGAGTVHDTAVLGGGFGPRGSITFRLYGPDTCAGPAVFSATRQVNGNASYVSADFAPTVPGTYHWRAAYSGDANNNAVAPTGCNDAAETVVVGPSRPTPCGAPTTGTVTGAVVVAAGQHRCFVKATVNGSITVNPGGELTVTSSIVTGGITSNGARAVDLCANDIGPGPSGTALSVTNTSGPIRIGDPPTGCNGNNIRGGLNLANNYDGLVLGSNYVHAGAAVNANKGGPIAIRYNLIDTTLACAANTPAPTDSGQANAAGAKTGQCASL